MKPNHIEVEWRGFWRAVGPKGASQTQHDEMRKAFFAGASALLARMMGALESGDEPTPNELQLMDEIDTELREFAASFVPEGATPS